MNLMKLNEMSLLRQGGQATIYARLADDVGVR